jgi:small-conductance mechanosensitive channel
MLMRRLFQDRPTFRTLILMMAVIPATARAEAPTTQSQVLEHVNLVLRWARQWTSPDVLIARAGDDLYLETGRQIAQQVVRLEFQSALAQAELISGDVPAQGPLLHPTGSIDAQNLQKAQQRVSAQLVQLQTALQAVNRKLAGARPAERTALLMSRDQLQGQIDLAQALQGNLQTLTKFATSAQNANGMATDLAAKIAALERTVPGVVGFDTSKATTAAKLKAAPINAPILSTNGHGLVGQIADMIRLMESLQALNTLNAEGERLQQSTMQLRAPLLAALRATLQEGQIELAGASQSASSAVATSAAPALNAGAPAAKPDSPAAGQPAATSLPEQQRAMAALVSRFKVLSRATLPLSQQVILVDQSQANLTQLKQSVEREYVAILRSLLIKTASILIALGLIWLFSWLWRRAAFRYIKDARRRRQFLVLRRVVTGFFMVVVIALGVISNFSSLATYAGLITAGVAVALQAVILSIAAYFFLVGRYGVRVGDRITVVYNGANSVAGDVVEIGLVRFYMVELAGSGIDLQPTGRIAVFPNSVLFQTNPLFKQLPGTEYVWREVALPLAREADLEAAEKRLAELAGKFYDEYRNQLERQNVQVEEAMGVHFETPRPHGRVRFANGAIEVMVRYPVPLRSAAELDDRMVVAVNQMLRQDPAIPLIAGGSPELRSPVRL